MNEPKCNLTVMAHRLPVVLTALPDEKVLAAKAAAATAEALGTSPQNTWNPAGATALLRPYEKKLLMRAIVSIVSNPPNSHLIFS